MGAKRFAAGVLVAEPGIVKPAAQNRQRFPHHNLVRRTREGVAASLPADALHQTAAAQDAHQLGNIKVLNAFLLADFGDGQAAAFAFPCKPQQASQSVFFLGREFHADFRGHAPARSRTPLLTSCPIATWPLPTSCPGSRAGPRPLPLSHPSRWSSAGSCLPPRRAMTWPRGRPDW